MPAGVAAGPFAQSAEDIGAGGRQRRGDAEDHTGQQTESDGEKHDAQIDRNDGVTGYVVRSKGDQTLHGPTRHNEPQQATGRPEHEALGHKLPYNPPASGANSRAYRYLEDARRMAGEQQVRDIRTGDGQHQSDTQA